jgi:hypothetical protein
MAIGIFPSKITRVMVIMASLRYLGSGRKYWRKRQGLFVAYSTCALQARALPRSARCLIPKRLPRRGHIGVGSRPGSPGTIHSMVRNERYRGRIVWNQTRKVRNPETGKKQGKPRPEEERIVADEPELRIVSEEQWEKVQAQNRRTQEKFGISRLGGLERTDRSNDYLFSGLLICAICGRRMVIVGGTGKYAK